MKRILIVKTSSLGDVIHALPAASDIHLHVPDSYIDWVVEESYASLVALHPAVRRIIGVALRRWRRALLSRTTWKEIGEFRQSVGAEPYDAVIDLQGLVKSAVIARAASGPRHGFDSATARERFAACFYDVTHRVDRQQHAVQRNRALAARALGYRVDERVDYGISVRPPVPPPARAYCVLLHMSSRRDKLWPETAWIEIGRAMIARGLDCVLPWGSDEERRRSERIAHNLDRARIPAFERLDRLAALLAGATAIVGVDTGLTHLAGALGRPVAAVFCGTDPRLTGVYGARRAENVGGPGASPSPEEVLQALESLGAF